MQLMQRQGSLTPTLWQPMQLSMKVSNSTTLVPKPSCEHCECIMLQHQGPQCSCICQVALLFCILLHKRASRKARLKVRCDQGRAAGRHAGGRRHRAAGGHHCGGGHQPTHVAQRPSAPLHGHHLQVCSRQVAIQACHGAQGEHSFWRGLSGASQEMHVT